MDANSVLPRDDDPLAWFVIRGGLTIAPQTLLAVALILIIDDEETVRDTVVMLLHMQGWETQTAEDGRAGLEQARRCRPDLMVCDVNMPVMNGLELLAEVRRDPALHSVPVVVITGQAGEEEHPALRQEAQAVLLKPFGCEELVALIREHLKPGPDAPAGACAIQPREGLEGAPINPTSISASPNTPNVPRSGHRLGILGQLRQGKRQWTLAETPGQDRSLFLTSVVGPLRELHTEGIIDDLQIHAGAYRGYQETDMVVVLGVPRLPKADRE